MAVETWIHSYRVDAPCETVYEYLSQPESYLKLSPLVVVIRDIEYGVDDEGRKQCRYKSVERFKFLGFLRYDNPINVTMTFTEPGQQIVCDVKAALGVSVRFVYDLRPEAHRTSVTETITAHMSGFAKGFVIQQAKTVQQHRIRTLNGELGRH